MGYWDDNPMRCKPKPLYAKPKGNNPPKLVGYICEEHDEIFTTNMTVSQPKKYVEANHGFQGRFLDNKKHRIRIKAVKRIRKGKKGESL